MLLQGVKGVIIKKVAGSADGAVRIILGMILT